MQNSFLAEFNPLCPPLPPSFSLAGHREVNCLAAIISVIDVEKNKCHVVKPINIVENSNSTSPLHAQPLRITISSREGVSLLKGLQTKK